METILTPCRVPWIISPSTSSVTLHHSESDVAPECVVVFGAWRFGGGGRKDNLRVEITFELCYYARVGPHSDTSGIEEIGYAIQFPIIGEWEDYFEWRDREWRRTGWCPNS